ncbi:SsrA-binding protein SmpB [Engelhardtia mirabilis]
MADSPRLRRPIATNRRAKHDYLFLEEFEAGIALLGTEVKSLRAGRASIQEAYALVKHDGVTLIGANIPEYPQAGPKMNHEPTRARRLLLHRKEIERLFKKVREKGVTLVPLELLFDGHLVKCRLALARGKKLHDKRSSEREKEAKRDMARAMGRRR